MGATAMVTEDLHTRDRLVRDWLRLVLGFAQMSLVAMAFGVLITTGLTPLAVLLAVSATALTLTSRLLYPGRPGRKVSRSANDDHSSMNDLSLTLSDQRYNR
jgi:hypothetical protein